MNVNVFLCEKTKLKMVCDLCNNMQSSQPYPQSKLSQLVMLALAVLMGNSAQLIAIRHCIEKELVCVRHKEYV